MPETVTPAFQNDIEENPLNVEIDEDPTNLADNTEEADEDALQIPPVEETEDDFLLTSSDEDDEQEGEGEGDGEGGGEGEEDEDEEEYDFLLTESD